jgi:hypothetical protein
MPLSMPGRGMVSDNMSLSENIHKGGAKLPSSTECTVSVGGTICARIQRPFGMSFASTAQRGKGGGAQLISF